MTAPAQCPACGKPRCYNCSDGEGFSGVDSTTLKNCHGGWTCVPAPAVEAQPTGECPVCVRNPCIRLRDCIGLMLSRAECDEIVLALRLLLVLRLDNERVMSVYVKDGELGACIDRVSHTAWFKLDDAERLLGLGGGE